MRQIDHIARLKGFEPADGNSAGQKGIMMSRAELEWYLFCFMFGFWTVSMIVCECIRIWRSKQ